MKKILPKEMLEKILEKRHAGMFIKTLNAVARHNPSTHRDVAKYTGLPPSTAFKALKDLAKMGIIKENFKETDTSQGIRNTAFYTTKYKIQNLILERTESFFRFKVEAFDIFFFTISAMSLILILLLRLHEAMGMLYSILILLPYWGWYKIMRGGRWLVR